MKTETIVEFLSPTPMRLKDLAPGTFIYSLGLKPDIEDNFMVTDEKASENAIAPRITVVSIGGKRPGELYHIEPDVKCYVYTHANIRLTKGHEE